MSEETIWTPERIKEALAKQSPLTWRERWSLNYMGKVWKWGARLGLLRVRKDGNEGWVWKRKPTFYTAENLIAQLRLESMDDKETGN